MKKVFAPLLIMAFCVLSFGYWLLMMDNVAGQDRRLYINVPTGSSVSDVYALLAQRKLVHSLWGLKLVARVKGYHRAIPGHYVFKRNMSNRELVNLLQSGNTSPVKLVIYNIRTKEELAGLVGRTIELDSLEVISRLKDTDYCIQYDLDANTIVSHYIADNYELDWNITMPAWIALMDSQYHRFWDGDRAARAEEMGYSPSQITTLASIVEKECIYDEELPMVAGVYLNRLKINMPLQADPTLIFASRDFDARRVTNSHKAIASPYNTYKHKGLPPGPICLPRAKAIDAVLHALHHQYLYFCAAPDMSGHSIFSRSLVEQNEVATAYRNKLNEKGIK